MSRSVFPLGLTLDTNSQPRPRALSHQPQLSDQINWQQVLGDYNVPSAKPMNGARQAGETCLANPRIYSKGQNSRVIMPGGEWATGD